MEAVQGQREHEFPAWSTPPRQGVGPQPRRVPKARGQPALRPGAAKPCSVPAPRAGATRRRRGAIKRSKVLLRRCPRLRSSVCFQLFKLSQGPFGKQPLIPPARARSLPPAVGRAG